MPQLFAASVESRNKGKGKGKEKPGQGAGAAVLRDGLRGPWLCWGQGGNLGLEMRLGARAARSHLPQGPSLQGGEEFVQTGNKKHFLLQWKKKEERIVLGLFEPPQSLLLRNLHLEPLGKGQAHL